jgi:hypothetical protein
VREVRQPQIGGSAVCLKWVPHRHCSLSIGTIALALSVVTAYPCRVRRGVHAAPSPRRARACRAAGRRKMPLAGFYRAPVVLARTEDRCQRRRQPWVRFRNTIVAEKTALLMLAALLADQFAVKIIYPPRAPEFPKRAAGSGRYFLRGTAPVAALAHRSTPPKRLRGTLSPTRLRLR